MDNQRPSNKEIINKYLEHYRHSPQSLSMRRSSLNYFFGKQEKKCFGYQGHIFDIETSVLIEFFEWLKNLDLVSIQTRKNKWAIIKSLLQYTMEFYNAKKYNIFIVIPSKTVDWKGAVPKRSGNHSNADVYATKDEIQRILHFLRNRNFKHYIIFRTFIDTGMRKGELREARVSELYIEKRYFHTRKGKTGEKMYAIRKDLATLLKIYLDERMKYDVKTDILFLNKYLRKYSLRSFNLILKDVCKKVKISKNITTKTFRKSLNDFRKEMGCNTEDREMLLGHKTNRVNIRNYTRSDIARHIETYDRWYPYIDLAL